MNKNDNSPRVNQREKFKDVIPLREFQWKPKQIEFINCALEKNTKAILCDGLWGCGKTLLSVYCSLKLLSEKKIDSILYIRSPIESGKSIGFLQGSSTDKMQPYGQPFYDKLHELIIGGSSIIKKLEADNRIIVMPVGFMRGLSLNCKAIIIDEASSLTKNELELILSRIGAFSKIFIIGSKIQSDIKSSQAFCDLIALFNDKESKEHGIFTFEFNEEGDILRSEILRFIMKKIGAIPSG